MTRLVSDVLFDTDPKSQVNFRTLEVLVPVSSQREVINSG